MARFAENDPTIPAEDTAATALPAAPTTPSTAEGTAPAPSPAPSPIPAPAPAHKAPSFFGVTRPVPSPIPPPVEAVVVGNVVRVKAGGSDVVNLEVIVQREAPRPAGISRRDVFVAATGAASWELTRQLSLPLLQPLNPRNVSTATPPVTSVVRSDILPPKSGFLSALPKTNGRFQHSAEFIVYLSGFLLNFDLEWQAWWQSQLRRVPFAFAPVYRSDTQKRTLYVREQFGDLAAALREVVNKVSAKDLCALLVDRHGTDPVARHQLALLFALLDPIEQPLPLIASLLMAELSSPGAEVNATALIAKLGTKEVTAASKDILQVPDSFLPPMLLPRRVFPVYETSGELASGRWLVSAADCPSRETGFALFNPKLLGRTVDEVNRGFNLITVLLLALAGGTASAVAHTFLHPIDNLKIQKQAKSKVLPEAIPISLDIAALPTVAAAKPTLLTGIVAAVVGYALYGIVVFPAFEVGKLWLSSQVSISQAVEFRLLFVLSSSVAATALGCLVTVPWEAAKIRAITQPGYAPNAVLVITRIIREEGLAKLFAGYPFFASRNIVFSLVKFSVFDYFWDVVSVVYPTIPVTESALVVSFTKGIVAGLLGSLVSQPLDVLLTRVAKSSSKDSLVESATRLWQEQGVGGLYAGLVFRSLAAAASISLQFFIYDYIKSRLFQILLEGVS